MSEALVFCTKGWPEGEPGGEGYGFFLHEADVLLYSLGQEVAGELITSEQAREIYARHYDIEDTYLVQPEDIEGERAAYWKDWQKHYGSQEEVEEDLDRALGEYGNFPLNEEMDNLPNSMDFWQEAAGLRLEGVGFSDDVSPSSEPIFEVENADALATLKEAVEVRYRIVVFDDVNDYVLADHKDAIEFIERMR